MQSKLIEIVLGIVIKVLSSYLTKWSAKQIKKAKQKKLADERTEAAKESELARSRDEASDAFFNLK